MVVVVVWGGVHIHLPGHELPGQQSTRFAGTVQLPLAGIGGDDATERGRCSPASRFAAVAVVAVPPKRLVEDASTLPAGSHSWKAPEAWSTSTAP